MSTEMPDEGAVSEQPRQNVRLTPQTIDRITYWRHITLSFCMLLVVWPIVFLLPALPDNYATYFSGLWGGGVGTLVIGYVLIMFVYQWSTIVRRVRDAQRSTPLWVIGLILLPYINFFLLIRLGLIKHSTDQSVLSANEKVKLGLWMVAFTVVFWAGQLTVWMFGYVSNASAG